VTVQTLPATGPGLVGFPTPDEITAIEQQVEKYARSNLLPAAIRGKANDVFTVLMVARDLGLPATSGLFKVHVVEGKPTLAADLMVALLLAHGHDVWLEESTQELATYAGKRRGSERITRITYTFDEAKAAGLVKEKGGWVTARAAMLRARASSALCRVLAPDVLGGIASSFEEAQDEASATVAAPVEPLDVASAAERLKAAAEPEPPGAPETADVVDGEVVPGPADTTDPDSGVNSLAAAYLGDATTADTVEALQDVWREASANGVLDEIADGTTTLREALTAMSDAIKARQP
jgi:hypothetical protein